MSLQRNIIEETREVINAASQGDLTRRLDTGMTGQARELSGSMAHHLIGSHALRAGPPHIDAVRTARTA